MFTKDVFQHFGPFLMTRMFIFMALELMNILDYARYICTLLHARIRSL